MAWASTSAKDFIKKPPANHPLISLRPNDPKSVGKATSQEKDTLEKTLFHEQLHNLGYRHGHDIEFPYACESCCLEKKGDTVKACGICTGNYTGATDVNYVKDFVDFTLQDHSETCQFPCVIEAFLKENPGSPLGITLFAKAHLDIFDPLGPALANVIEQKTVALGKEESENISFAQRYRKAPTFRVLSTTSETVANAIYELYFNRNGIDAIDLLEANKEAIKRELVPGGGASHGEYARDNARNALKSLIYDIWLNQYPEGEATASQTRAGRLRQFFE